MDMLPSKNAFFHLPEDEAVSYDDAKVVIIPFGLEASVSYGGGTARGPQAMIDASPELELFDEELWCEPFREIGVVTIADPYLSHWERSKSAQTILGEGQSASPHPNPLPGGEGTCISEALELLSSTVEQVLSDGKFPFVFGGEHSISAGSIRPFAKRYDDLAILHFDAHADLRDGYLGEHYSHACALRRCLDHPQVTQLVSCGIRNISASEIPYYEANRDRIHIHWAKDKADWNIEEIVAPLKGKPVYITFDLDGFDASLMPATGTPEPGGLFWHDAVAILREAVKVCDGVVGADINELAPIPGYHAADFLAAKLAYKIMSYWFLRGKL